MPSKTDTAKDQTEVEELETGPGPEEQTDATEAPAETSKFDGIDLPQDGLQPSQGPLDNVKRYRFDNGYGAKVYVVDGDYVVAPLGPVTEQHADGRVLRRLPNLAGSYPIATNSEHLPQVLAAITEL